MENKFLRITMPDDSQWDVSVMIIAKNRAKWYEKDFGSFEESLYKDTLPLFEDDYEIEDWAENNMNWEDVKDFAKKVILPTLEVDYQDGWINGKKEIIIENIIINDKI